MLFYGFCIVTGVAGGMVHFMSDSDLTWPGSSLVWVGGLVLLVYGLIRDLYLLKTCPCDKLPKEEKKRSSMMCVESCVGMSAVVLGLTLQWLNWSQPVTFSTGLGLVFAAVIMAFGHLVRDWVFILAVVPDHSNVIPTFRLHTAEETQTLLR